MIDFYDEYKNYYVKNILTLPGDKRTLAFFYYMLKRQPYMTLHEFAELEDTITDDID